MPQPIDLKGTPMPKASIIVPAHNAAATLLGTLESLLGQTYRDFEIIVVDDGSTDATRRIAEAYCADPRVRVVRQKHTGVSAARNTGIDLARGRFIGFCDADDMWLPSKLGTHLAHLDANPDVGFSFSAATLIDGNNTLIGEVRHTKTSDITPTQLFKRNPVGSISTMVARREALEDLSYRPYHENKRDWIFDEHLEAFEDLECWLRAALTTEWTFEALPDLLTRQRVNSGAQHARAEERGAAWDQMVSALRPVNPAFFARHEASARSHQLHFLTRNPVRDALHEEAMSALRAEMLNPPKPNPSGFAAMVKGIMSNGPVPAVTRGAPASWV